MKTKLLSYKFKTDLETKIELLIKAGWQQMGSMTFDNGAYSMTMVKS